MMLGSGLKPFNMGFVIMNTLLGGAHIPVLPQSNFRNELLLLYLSIFFPSGKVKPKLVLH